MLRELLLAAIVTYLLLHVGGMVMDGQVNGLQQQAIKQAETACNTHLPGENWSVENESVDADDFEEIEEIQEVACARNGTVRNVTVDIDIQVNA